MKLFYTLVLLTVFVLLFFKDLPVSLHLLLSSFIIGSFFKFMHWPGASATILLGMAIGAFVFLPLLFLFKKKEGD